MKQEESYGTRDELTVLEQIEGPYPDDFDPITRRLKVPVKEVLGEGDRLNEWSFDKTDE